MLARARVHTYPGPGYHNIGSYDLNYEDHPSNNSSNFFCGYYSNNEPGNFKLDFQGNFCCHNYEIDYCEYYFDYYYNHIKDD